ncbi:PerC family transcriptional regulator [Enterobacter hormaechei]|uniref:PerC family transcriptional regulator n=1 Tax=Enterobacter hormaechei TaxID=158836 RepID=UPI004045131C
MVHDTKAEELEAKGLYRRAAARWAEVMALCTEDDDREWIAKKRAECLSFIKRPPVKVEEFGDLHKAARETQQRMGISKPDGEAFRLPVSRKRTQEGRKKC